MDEVVSEFDWYSERTPNEKCRVSVRQSRSVAKVYIEAYADGVRKSPGVTFRAEELPHIIAALQEAEQVLKR